MGLRGHGVLVEIAVKQVGDLILWNAAAGVRHGQKHPPGRKPQLHGDGSAVGGEFQGVGEQLIEQLLHGKKVKRADVALHGAAELQPDVPEGGQTLGGVTDLADSLHQIPVPDRQRPFLAQGARRVQIVYQPQHPIIALVQQGSLGVQLRVPLPFRGGGQLGGGQVHIRQRAAQLDGNIGKYGGNIEHFLVHMGTSSPPKRICSIYGRAASNRGKACLKHQ